MKISRKFLAIIILIIANIFLIASTSFAATTSVYFKLYNGSQRPTGYYYIQTRTGRKPITKIVKANSAAGASIETYSTDTDYFSLKNETGFSRDANSQKAFSTVLFSQKFDMNNPNEIPSIYKTTLPQYETTYNKVMWLLENFCIPQNTNSRNILLTQAGIDQNAFDKYDIPGKSKDEIQSDLIEIAEQAALWHFTNGEDITGFQFSQTQNGAKSNINSLAKLDDNSSPVNALYNYLINAAENNVRAGYTYSKESTNGEQISLDKSNATVQETSSNYLVGPYKLNVQNGTVGSINVVITDETNSQTNNVTILGADQKTELSGNSVNEKIGHNLNQNFYIAVPLGTSAKNISINVNYSYIKTDLTYFSTSANTVNSEEPIAQVKKITTEGSSNDTNQITKPTFDLALREYITEVNGEDTDESREPKYTQENLRQLATLSGTTIENTTLVKEHTKTPIAVKKGDKVLYTIKVYNEGQVAGTANEITSYLPDGLTLAKDSETNSKYAWKMYDASGNETQDASNAKTVKTNYLSDKKIDAFNVAPQDGKYTINSNYVKIECEVAKDTSREDIHLKLVSEITASSNDQNLQDRDSRVNNLSSDQKLNYAPGTSEKGKGYEDDDDYEDIVVRGRYFDLALRKFVSKVNDKTISREPVVDVTPLLSGKTSANYKHQKAPVSVEAGNTIIYTIRIYNEGQVDGYADEVVDHLPPELEFVNDEFNAENGWVLDTSDSTQRTVRTTKLSKENDDDNKIKAFNDETKEISYKDLYIKCTIKNTAETQKEITNIAEITKSSNDFGLADRDNKASVSLPSDVDLSSYKGNSENKGDLTDKDYYYQGQEDDDDFEKIILEKFDIALKEFITKVNDENIEDRVPVVDKSNFGQVIDGREVTSCTYNKNSTPLKVEQNDIITYTIRVYNEGTKEGYASIIKNSFENGLEFLPDNDVNKAYGWTMLDENMNITADSTKAKYATTDYLSKGKETTTGQNLLKTFDVGKMQTPDYRDIKIAFKVLAPVNQDRTIENKAEIAKCTDKEGENVTDADSAPNKWNDGEDDQDSEIIYVKYFDLSLQTWVTKAIVIENGEEKTIDTKHTAEQNPEPVVKVDIEKKNLEENVIKFNYSIRVKNDGEITGYATEISDYIPSGLKFNQADNPKWKEANGKITTDQLKDTILNPGDTQTIEVTLTWINSEDNMGTMSNVTEISIDKNNSNTPDINSTPNNKLTGENDIDTSSTAVMATAGTKPTYIILISAVLAIIGGSIFVIKKYVL